MKRDVVLATSRLAKHEPRAFAAGLTELAKRDPCGPGHARWAWERRPGELGAAAPRVRQQLLAGRCSASPAPERA